MNDEIIAIIEGLLFIVGDEGLTVSQLAQVIEKDEEETLALVDELQRRYLADVRGMELVNYGGSLKFVSRALVHPYAQKLFADLKSASLSPAALETLAIVAYKQPITRIEIEEIRGVGCDVMLRKLQARGLIREAGRSVAAGRPILYEVTEEFMDSFKLLSLDELPELPQFQSEESQKLFD